MRVGTRDSLGTKLLAARDHPHACGDKFLIQNNTHFVNISSPCVWGQVCIYSDYNTPYRIIPMRVGTSFSYIPVSI